MNYPKKHKEGIFNNFRHSKPYIKLIILFSAIAIVFLLIIGINAGLQNQTDDYYYYLDTLLAANGFESKIKLNEKQIEKYRIITAQDKLQDLKTIYEKQHSNNPDVMTFEDVMLKPFLPSWEYNKLLKYYHPLIKNKKIVISGVSGSGKTTLVERLALFITANHSRILQLQCVEEMAVEYHKEWIGHYDNGVFYKGKLLRFFEECNNHKEDKFVFILDDFDKIYPSTFFGSELWKEMDSPNDKNTIDGYGEISLPDNFYLISITHIGVANVITLNNEHFRRLGELYHINPDVNEFLIGIKERIESKKLNIPTNHIKKVLYFFKKANDLITEKYGLSYTLGQWATIRKKIEPEDWDDYNDEFITHVNSFKPAEELHEKDFSDIFFTLDNHGLLNNSHFFYIIYQELLQTGLFSELTVALGFAIISGLFGWFFIIKKRDFINRFQFDVLDITERFKHSQITHEQAVNEIFSKKALLEKLILKRKIKYEESTFLLMYINEQIKAIDEINKAIVVSKDFQNILGEYMADGVLDDEEYSMLVKFLDNIRSALTPEVYYSLKNKIDDIKFKKI